MRNDSMERFQLFTDVLTRISEEYPTHFHDKDKLLALFIDLSPKSKVETKALRSFVVNDCNKKIDNLKGEKISFATETIIRLVYLICGNPNIEQEAAVALCQAYADIVGVKYDRNRIQQEFGLPAVITPANIHSSPSRISKSPQSNASASTPASVSHASPPTPKPNKTTIQRKKWFLHERVAFICFLGFIICLICFIMGVESEDITAPVVIIWNRSSLIYCIITFLFMCLLPSPHKKEEVRPVPSSVKCLATIMIITSIVTLIMLRLNHTFNELSN